jgi:hypothetical protein
MLYLRLWTPSIHRSNAPSGSPAPNPGWRRRSATRTWRSTRPGGAARSRPGWRWRCIASPTGPCRPRSCGPDLWARPQDVPILDLPIVDVTLRTPARSAQRTRAVSAIPCLSFSRCPSRRSLPHAATDRCRSRSLEAGEPRHGLRLAPMPAWRIGPTNRRRPQRGDVMAMSTDDEDRPAGRGRARARPARLHLERGTGCAPVAAMRGGPQRQHHRQGARPRRFALRCAGQVSSAQIAAARVQAARCAQGKGRAQAPPRAAPGRNIREGAGSKQLMAVFRTLGLDGMFGEPGLRTVHQHSGKAFGPACTLIDASRARQTSPSAAPRPSSAIPIASPIA